MKAFNRWSNFSPVTGQYLVAGVNGVSNTVGVLRYWAKLRTPRLALRIRHCHIRSSGAEWASSTTPPAVRPAICGWPGIFLSA